MSRLTTLAHFLAVASGTYACTNALSSMFRASSVSGAGFMFVIFVFQLFIVALIASTHIAMVNQTVEYEQLQRRCADKWTGPFESLTYE